MATLNDTPVWVDEPPRSIRRESPIWAELRSRPGSWALIGEGQASGSASVHKKNHPDFEIVNRNTRKVDGRAIVDVYARYIGEVSP